MGDVLGGLLFFFPHFLSKLLAMFLQISLYSMYMTDDAKAKLNVL